MLVSCVPHVPGRTKRPVLWTLTARVTQQCRRGVWLSGHQLLVPRPLSPSFLQTPLGGGLRLPDLSSHLGLLPCFACVSFQALLWGPVRVHGAGTTRKTPLWLGGWHWPLSLPAPRPRCLWREKVMREGDSPRHCPEPGLSSPSGQGVHRRKTWGPQQGLEHMRQCLRGIDRPRQPRRTSRLGAGLGFFSSPAARPISGKAAKASGGTWLCVFEGSPEVRGQGSPRES